MYDRNHYFGLGLIPKPKWANTCGRYRKVHIFSEATKFCKISTIDLSYVVPVKSSVEISKNFVAFPEYMNFIMGPDKQDFMPKIHTQKENTQQETLSKSDKVFFKVTFLRQESSKWLWLSKPIIDYERTFFVKNIFLNFIFLL